MTPSAFTRRAALALLTAGALAATAVQAKPPLEALEIATAKGPARFQVEIADTPASRERGLMFRKSVAPGYGMLFDFREERPVAFWMKNTLVPLDMIFIQADGRILSIARNTTPHSLEPVPSGGPIRGVLEIAGGRAAQLGILPGDKVRHRIFPRG